MNEFKLMIAGGRDFEDYDLMSLVLYSLADHALADEAISIVSEDTEGTGQLAEAFAREHGIIWHKSPEITENISRNPGIDFDINGLLAFWNGENQEIKSLIETMKKKNSFLHVVKY